MQREIPLLNLSSCHVPQHCGVSRCNRGSVRREKGLKKHCQKKFLVIFPTPLLRNYGFFGLSPIFCIAKHRGEGCSVLSYRIKTHLTITKVRNVSPSCPAHACAIGEVAGGRREKKQGKNIKSTLSQNEKYHF